MTRFIQSIQIQNLLSFGPDTGPLVLGDLNVLIGPNGSGKSNFIDVIEFLRNLPSGLDDALRKMGGLRGLYWKGKAENFNINVFYSEGFIGKNIVGYSLTIGNSIIFGPSVLHEHITYKEGKEIYRYNEMEEYEFYDRNGDLIKSYKIEPEQSVLSQIRGLGEPYEINYLTRRLLNTKIYSSWFSSRNNMLRTPQPSDSKNDYLNEYNQENLGIVLNKMYSNFEIKKQLDKYVQKLYKEARTISFLAEGGTLQFFLEEEDVYIPSQRLSDGTIKYLCLVAILLNPSPPPLICIEEPESGLHPDIISTIADLLIDASTRTQIFVSTHSVELIDALSSVPESIIVCEKENGSSKFSRLDKQEMDVWLERYRLGELWSSGQIGGNRW